MKSISKDLPTILLAIVVSVILCVIITIGVLKILVLIFPNSTIMTQNFGQQIAPATKDDNNSQTSDQNKESASIEKNNKTEENGETDNNIKSTNTDNLEENSNNILEGSSKVEIPDFKDKNRTKIKSACRKLKIKPIFLSEYNSDVPKYLFIRSEPQAKEIIETNSEIKIYISKGPEKNIFKMPNLIGLTRDGAIEELVKNNLKLGKIIFVEDSLYAFDAVADQNIKPYSDVEINTQIDIKINKFKK